jgi:hypothetical protein
MSIRSHHMTNLQVIKCQWLSGSDPATTIASPPPISTITLSLSKSAVGTTRVVAVVGPLALHCGGMLGQLPLFSHCRSAPARFSLSPLEKMTWGVVAVSLIRDPTDGLTYTSLLEIASPLLPLAVLLNDPCSWFSYRSRGVVPMVIV